MKHRGIRWEGWRLIPGTENITGESSLEFRRGNIVSGVDLDENKHRVHFVITDVTLYGKAKDLYQEFSNVIYDQEVNVKIEPFTANEIARRCNEWFQSRGLYPKIDSEMIDTLLRKN